jgi:hypothetical protein
MRKSIQHTLSGLLLLLILMTTGCSEYAFVDCETYDYSDCETRPATTGNLEVSLSLPDGTNGVPVVLYKGNYPSSDTVFVDTLKTSLRTYALEMGQVYSMTAEYTVNGQRILAVDGDEVSQKSYNVCDSVCWLNRDGKLDLRLKFDE